MSFSRYKYAILFPKALGVVLLISLFFGGCGVRKIIPQDQYLLRKNKVKIISETRIDGDYTAQILHRTNKRVLFNQLPIFLWLHALGTSVKHPEINDSIGWRRKLRNSLGEAPVIYNPQLAQISADNIKYYLFNKGYFDATCTYEVKTRRRKAYVTYTAVANKPYTIQKIEYEAPDSAILKIIKSATQSSGLFRMYWPCNLNKFSEGQDYIASQLRDSGFFTVSLESLKFEIDTNQFTKHTKVKIRLLPPTNSKTHKKYTIGNVSVYFNTNKDYLLNNYPQRIQFPGLDVQLNHYPLKSKNFPKIITIDSGNYFSQSKWSETYRKLSESGLYSGIDIRQTIDNDSGIIRPLIYLKTFPRLSFSTEPQLLYSPQGSSGLNFITSQQRSFGLAGIVSFSNRNVFGNAEYFKLSSITSYEAIFKRGNLSEIFTGLQQGLVASLKLPGLSALDRVNVLRQFDQKNTLLSLSYQYEQNINFTRSSLPASLSFQFIKPRLSWFITPLEISYNRNIVSPEFLPQLPKLDQEFVRRVFTDQIITPVKLGFIYSNSLSKPGQTSKFVRLGFETSGNWHHLYRKLYEKQYRDDSVYNLFGVNYFQYSKIEAEFRLKRNIDELNGIAFRFNSGLAIPYGNSNLVPYDKRYFIGGSNSLRAWQPRTLGPGNTPKGVASRIDRSGELLLEANLEYRFTIIKQFIESAIFFDAGNIWNLQKSGVANPLYGVINRQNFMKEVALNTGIGLRFDLSIFMFRVDWGIPLRDPSLPETQRWIFTETVRNSGFRTFVLQETAIAIGIGYPF
jgi:hypothetical protein